VTASAKKLESLFLPGIATILEVKANGQAYLQLANLTKIHKPFTWLKLIKSKTPQITTDPLASEGEPIIGKGRARKVPYVELPRKPMARILLAKQIAQKHLHHAHIKARVNKANKQIKRLQGTVMICI
jgi:hypothetical protein